VGVVELAVNGGVVRSDVFLSFFWRDFFLDIEVEEV